MTLRLLVLLVVAGWASLTFGHDDVDDLRNLPLDLTDHEAITDYVRKVAFADVNDLKEQRKRDLTMKLVDKEGDDIHISDEKGEADPEEGIHKRAIEINQPDPEERIQKRADSTFAQPDPEERIQKRARSEPKFTDLASIKEEDEDEDDDDKDDDKDDDDDDDDDKDDDDKDDDDEDNDDDLAVAALEHVEEEMEEANDIVEKSIEAAKENGETPKEIEVEVQTGQGEIDGKDLELPPITIEAKVETEDSSDKQNLGTTGAGSTVFASAIGMGGAIMNGCFGTGYAPGDPCYDVAEVTSRCLGLMEACTYIGVGFDGRGIYGPESRKGNVLELTCNEKRFYLDEEGNHEDVPDMMSISGIYDTLATTNVYTSSEQYRNALEITAGISGTYGGFSGSVEASYGQDKQGQSRTFLAVMEIDIMRYEVYLSKFTSSMLTVPLVHEFMDLPKNYYTEGSAQKYQEFILRWGTHYVKSAEFGGKLEIRQSQKASSSLSVQKFSVAAKASYKSFFSVSGHFGAKGTFQNSEMSQNLSLSIQVEGGNAMIAKAIADAGSTDMRTDIHEWLQSIREFPKPFNFRLSRLTDLFTFTSADLFPSSSPKKGWGCESADLYTDEQGFKYYWMQVDVVDPKTNKTSLTKQKKFCDITSRQQLTDAIKDRRDALERAITTYLLQGPQSYGQFDLIGKEDCYLDLGSADAVSIPKWELLRHNEFLLRLGLPDTISSRFGTLEKDIEYIVGYSMRLEQWYYKDIITEVKDYHLGTYASTNMMNKQILGIGGLFMTFNETEGYFTMDEDDYKRSTVNFPTLPDFWKDGRPLAFAEGITPFHSFPCSYKFSNAQRISPKENEASCIRFLSASDGTVYIIAAANPERKSTWYTTLVSPSGIAFYKGDYLQKTGTSTYLAALGSSSILQTYFVCITKVSVNNKATVVLEYGKARTTETAGVIYMMMADVDTEEFPSYYAFGAGEKDVVVSEAYLTYMDADKRECGPHLEKNTELNVCVDANCHALCNPIAGCTLALDGIPKPDECAYCLILTDYIKGVRTCVSSCRKYYFPEDGVCTIKCPDLMVEKDGDCQCVIQEGTECVEKCSGDTLPKLNEEIGGASSICTCIYTHDEKCVDGCPDGTAKIPDLVFPGFFLCKAPKGSAVTGKTAVGAVLVTDVEIESPDDCYDHCIKKAVSGDPESCGGYEWDSNDGGKCYLHKRLSVCNTQTDNPDRTLVMLYPCVSDSSIVLARGFIQSDLVMQGEGMTFSDCKKKCDTDNCYAISYNLDSSQCWFLPGSKNLCKYRIQDYKLDVKWMTVLSSSCSNTGFNSNCKVSVKGTEYRGTEQHTAGGTHCWAACRNPTNDLGERPWCKHGIWGHWGHCNIPWCTPHGYELTNKKWCSKNEQLNPNDENLSFEVCWQRCTADPTCVRFYYDTNPKGIRKCIMQTNTQCLEEAGTTWGGNYVKQTDVYPMTAAA